MTWVRNQKKQKYKNNSLEKKAKKRFKGQGLAQSPDLFYSSYAQEKPDYKKQNTNRGYVLNASAVRLM